jgi:CRISPR/Cas system-associated endonuclease Cas3-HD
MYITVLNFVDGKVYRHDVGSGMLQSEDYEAFLDREGYKLNSIEWMLHDDPEVITN